MGESWREHTRMLEGLGATSSRWLETRPRSLALVFGGALSIVALFCVELAAQVLECGAPQVDRRYASGYWTLDETTGLIGPEPGGSYRTVAHERASGALIYDVTYTVDAHGRRSTPHEPRGRRSRFLLFFGGSFTYGEGVSDAQALPARAAALATQYRAYNYGFHGHGPAEMLIRLRAGHLEREVDEATGCLIYTFVDEHVERTIGSMSVVGSWGGDKPYFRRGPNGELVNAGSFNSERAALSAVYRILARSALLRGFGVDLPPWTLSSHLDLIADIIGESRALFSEQFPGSCFLVVLYPSSRRADLSSFLAERNIDYLDYRGLFDREAEPFRLSVEDPHPTPLAYEVLARKLTRDLAERAESQRVRGLVAR